jgi:hypothetical protein
VPGLVWEEATEQDSAAAAPGTQFTCFTGTKVHMLTPEELRARRVHARSVAQKDGLQGAVLEDVC